MSELAERLRSLRAQAGVAVPRAASVLAAVPEAVPRAASVLTAVPEAAPRGREIPRCAVPEELRRLLGVRARVVEPSRLAPLLRGEGEGAARRVGNDRVFPGEEVAPGLVYAESWHEAPGLPERIDAGFARQGVVESRRLLAFDTETTGLAGGTGTRAFMIGAADLYAGRLRLRQLTMLTMAAEGELLRHFRAWIDADTVLVSYNGKSYDAPLLATRLRLARQPNPLPACTHLDLLHPVRRRWRGHWPNCRLATAERQLLGVVREDDLPGSEAPRAWLDYLRGGSARDLRRVAAHNAQDLRSLMGVLQRLAELAAA